MTGADAGRRARRRASGRPGRPGRPRTRRRWSAGRRPASATGRRPGRRPSSVGAFAEVGRGPRRGVRRGRRGRDQLLRLRRASMVDTTYLGTSTGLRLRHVQPTGRVELNGKSADFGRSAWAGTAPATSATCRRGRRSTPTSPGGSAGRSAGVDLPAGRYETMLPPVGGRRPDRLPLLDDRGPGTPTRAARCSPSRAAATAIGERLSPAAPDAAQRPAAARPGVRAVRRSRRPRRRARSVFDNGLPLPRQ